MSVVVVDANIIFSSLLSEENRYAEVLLTETKDKFFAPRFAIVEIFKYKEKISKRSKCPEEVLLELFHKILKKLVFMDEDLVSLPVWREAWELVKNIDEKDLTFVAMAIELNAQIWTIDQELKEGLKAKGFDKFYEPFSKQP